MAFQRRLLPVADQLTATLDKRYANLNHNHDAIYSKLGHSHTANQISGFLGTWDQRSIVVEPIYNALGQVYEVKQDGWLKVSMITNSWTALLTIPLSSFDGRIQAYDSIAAGTKFGEADTLVKRNGTYWLSRTSGTVGNANDGPGESDNRWTALPSWIPCVGIVHIDALSSADTSSTCIVIPCRAGERYAGVVGEADQRSYHKWVRGYGYNTDNKIGNQFSIQYLPPTYQSTEVGLIIREDMRITDRIYRYDSYKNTLSRVPLLYR